MPVTRAKWVPSSGAACLIAIVVGLALIALSPLLKPLSISLMGGSPDVQSAASTYFSYRIWAAPAALANFTILGWFIGQGRTKVAFVTQLALNVTNMVLSSLFVLHFDMGIAGVGLAVLIAEYSAVASRPCHGGVASPGIAPTL